MFCQFCGDDLTADRGEGFPADQHARAAQPRHQHGPGAGQAIHSKRRTVSKTALPVSMHPSNYLISKGLRVDLNNKKPFVKKSALVQIYCIVCAKMKLHFFCLKHFVI